jgi:hypothetical protein
VAAAIKIRSSVGDYLMKTLRITASVVALTLGAFVSTSGQQPVAPPPKPADSGPSLEVTIKFIQEKMNSQGQVGYIYAKSDTPAVRTPMHYEVSSVLADHKPCSLSATETTLGTVEFADGTPLTDGDVPTRILETKTVSFKDVEKITVESVQDRGNRGFTEQARPEVTVTVTPPIFYLVLSASKAVFSSHKTVTYGMQPVESGDYKLKEQFFEFRDEDTANRVAKAMVHAVELCGGGNKDPF